MNCRRHDRLNCPIPDCRFDRIDDALLDIFHLLTNLTQKQETLMSAFTDLKTEVESFITDVQADTDALGAKIAALQAAIDSGASATDIAGLTAEVTAAHQKLSGTVAAPPSTTAT